MMRTIHVAVFAAIAGCVAIAFGIAVSKTQQDPGSSRMTSMLESHWDNVPMDSVDGPETQTYAGTVPLCKDASATVCVVSGNSVRVKGKTKFLRLVEAPPAKSKCEEVRLLADQAAARLSAVLSSGSFTIGSATDFGQPGNVVFITIGNMDVGKILIREKLARPARSDNPGWCAEDEMAAKAAEKQRQEKTWGDRFNPSGEIPESGFKAVYFDRDSWFFPKTTRENTNRIAISFGRTGPGGIHAGSFGGYWVGKLSFDEPTSQSISIDEHGATRIRINGETVYMTGKQRREFTHDFAAGDHVVEVEYANGWHTVGFKVSIGDDEPEIAQSSLFDVVKSMGLNDAKLHYVGVYKPSTKDFTIDIDSFLDDDPVVLWLDSYDATDWILPDDRKVALVVVASSNPGSSVVGGNVRRVLHLDGYIGVRNPDRKCSCRNKRVYCEYKEDLLDAARSLRQSTGLELAAFTVDYRMDRVDFEPFDQRVEDALFETRKEEKSLESSCRPRA